MQKKGRHLFAISYLIARLQWALETSRLLIFRIKPRTRIVQFVPNAGIIENSQWIFTRYGDFCLTYSPLSEAPVIRKLPERLPN